MEKCLIALSGGVDSSVAARLMLDAGWQCVGGTMVLHDRGPDPSRDAAAVAAQLGIPFCAFDCREPFRREVMDDFARCYDCGETPNPCIRCNRHLKFGALLEKAVQLGCSHVVTGHYARVTWDQGRDRWLLRKGADAEKDQSYFLYGLTQQQLAHTLFPLGGMTKGEIRAMAAAQGVVTAEKKDSQDVCFIPDGDYAAFVREFTGRDWAPGSFVDMQGKVLGKHRGIIHYTVGQRRGLGIAADTPLYVVRLCPETNTVVLGQNEDLFTRELTAENVNLIAMERLDAPLRCMAKIRSRHAEQPCTALQTGPDTLRVIFDEPQRAITPGQAVVLYDGDLVLGGGLIRKKA